MQRLIALSTYVHAWTLFDIVYILYVRIRAYKALAVGLIDCMVCKEWRLIITVTVIGIIRAYTMYKHLMTAVPVDYSIKN